MGMNKQQEVADKVFCKWNMQVEQKSVCISSKMGIRLAGCTQLRK